MNHLEKKSVYLFFIGHLLVSLIWLPHKGKGEIFPFFAWRIYSKCDPYESIPEIEILPSGEGRGVITNKDFKKRWRESFFRIRGWLAIKDQALADKRLNHLLHVISNVIQEKSFEYKIFKSRVHLVEYIKQDSLAKQELLKEGTFEKHPISEEEKPLMKKLQGIYLKQSSSVSLK